MNAIERAIEYLKNAREQMVLVNEMIDIEESDLEDKDELMKSVEDAFVEIDEVIKGLEEYQ